MPVLGDNIKESPLSRERNGGKLKDCGLAAGRLDEASEGFLY